MMRTARWLPIIAGACLIGALLAALILWQTAGPAETVASTAEKKSAAADRPVIARHTYLKIMTVNISFSALDAPAYRWRKRRALLVKILLRHAPDIIGMQESSAPQTAYLAAHLKGYAHVPSGAGLGSPMPLGIGLSRVNTIFYQRRRFALIHQQHGPLRPRHLQPDPTENAYYTMAVLRDRAAIFPLLVVVDTQLRHGNPNAAASAQRLDQVLRHQWRLDAGAGAIVMGDMNHSKTDTVVYDHLIGTHHAHGIHGRLRDSFDYAARPRGVLWGTWQQFIGKPVIKLPTDLIFTSRNLHASPAAILRDHSPSGRYPTDHYLVETRITPLKKHAASPKQ